MFEKKSQLKQTHTGTGDNILGDKVTNNIITELSFNDFVEQFESLLLSRKKFKSVKEKVENFLEISKLGSDVKAAFKIILILTDLKQYKLKKEFYQKVLSILTNYTKPKIRDWCISALIRIDILKENGDEARSRIGEINDSGILVNEVYFELY